MPVRSEWLAVAQKGLLAGEPLEDDVYVVRVYRDDPGVYFITLFGGNSPDRLGGSDFVEGAFDFAFRVVHLVTAALVVLCDLFGLHGCGELVEERLYCL